MKNFIPFLAFFSFFYFSLSAQSNCNNTITINSSNQILRGGMPAKYLFVPEKDGSITLQTCNLSSDQTWLALVRVFEDCNSTEIQPIIDSNCGDNQRTVIFKVFAGKRIRIELQTGIVGGDRLAFSFEASSCENAFQIECGIYYEGTNQDESNTFNDYGCPDATRNTSFNARDVLVKVVKANANDRLTVNIDNNRGFDLFLLEDCAPSNPECIQGRDINSNESIYNWLIEPKETAWAAGTYGISIDAIEVDNIGNFGIIATCGRLNCRAAKTIDCNTPISANTADGQNNISAYRFDGAYKAMNTGNELLYTFTIQEAQTVNLLLDILGNYDLELFLMSSCDEYDCIAKSTNEPGQDERINEFLTAGTYYVLVEGFNRSEGAFTLSLTADCGSKESTDCESPFYNGDATSLQCEKFEAYPLGTLSNEVSDWITWTSEHRNHQITNIRSSCRLQDNIISEGNRSLKVASFIENDTLINPDVVYKLGNRVIDQTHQLSWTMYVPAGKEAYFNIQKNQEREFEGGGEFELYFDKNKKLRLGTNSEGIYAYPQDRWFSVVLTFESINNEIRLTTTVDGIPVVRTKYGDTNTLLGGINFFATNEAEYYIDCICLNTLQCPIAVACALCTSSCINGIDFTCLACNDYGLDYSKVKFDNCPTYESTNAIKVSCGELRKKENLDGQNVVENYYGCFDSATDLKAKEKIYTFELTQTSDVTINAFTDGPNPNVELFLFSECLDNCVAQGKLTELEDRFGFFDGTQITQTSLQPGTYYVVVDDKDSERFIQAEDTYSISFNWDCGDLPRVCDLGGQFVNFGNKVEGTFGKTDHQLLNLRGADCIIDDLDGGIPADYVFDVFVFYNDGDAGDTNMGISDLDENLTQTGRTLITQVFECDCRDILEPTLNIISNEKDCYQNCIDNDRDGRDDATVSNPKVGTFYYFIVAGPEGTDYEFDFVPNSLCDNAKDISQTRIFGDTTLIGEKISSGSGDFSNTDEKSIYTNCTSSSNQYLGDEKLYELVIDRQVYIDITATTSTAMGMFLYHNDCGRDCRNADELPPNSKGGILSIVDSLLPGTYYLMVDSEDPGGGTFDLTINTNNKEEVFFLSQDLCPINEDQVHKVLIEGLDSTDIADNTYVIFHIDLGNNNHIPIINKTGPLQWDANTGELEVELYHDFEDSLQCSYIENDTFLIKLKPEDANGVQANSVIVRGVYIKDPVDFGDTATFKIGGSSGIEDFTESLITETLNLQVNGDCENSNSTGFPVDLTSNLDWYIDIPGGETWFTVSPMSGSNQERLNVTFNSVNSQSTTRTATFSVISTTGVKKEVTVCQKSSCSNFLAAAGLDKELGCTQEGVELSVNANGFPYLNTFKWKAISGSIKAGSFVEFDTESSVFVTESGQYEVAITNNFGCEFIDTINVFENLPMINSATINDNSVQGIADGSIAVNVSGGSPPYSYRWNGQNGNSTITNIPEGSYELEVTDNSGCTLKKIYTLEATMDSTNNDPDSGGSSTCSTESANALTTSSITETNAYIYTSRPHGTVSNQFRYRINGTSAWEETGINSNHYRLLSTLASGTTYEFQVRHNCGSNDWSAYSDSAMFTTNGSFSEGSIQLKRSPLTGIVKLFPNPAKKELNFISTIPFKDQQQITITNIWGQTLKVVPLSKGDNHQLIDISNLTSGIYLLRWDAEKTIETFKFIKD